MVPIIEIPIPRNAKKGKLHIGFLSISYIIDENVAINRKSKPDGLYPRIVEKKESAIIKTKVKLNKLCNFVLSLFR